MDAEKSSSERVGSLYAFKMMLRSERTNPKLFKTVMGTQINSPERDISYGIDQDHEDHKSALERKSSID